MINITDTKLWFNFRHDRQILYDLPKTPVTREQLARTLAVLLETQDDGLQTISHSTDCQVVQYAESLLERMDDEDERFSHVTTCCVMAEVDGEHVPLFEAMAYCSRKDNFCRRTGRWYTITRIVEGMADIMGSGGAENDLVDTLSHAFLHAYFARHESEENALAELHDYEAWLLTDYQAHREKEIDVPPDTTIAQLAAATCHVCHKRVGDDDRLAIAEQPLDGSPTELIPVPRIYHRACYAAAHPPEKDAA